jgi:hypothetical protein
MSRDADNKEVGRKKNSARHTGPPVILGLSLVIPKFSLVIPKFSLVIPRLSLVIPRVSLVIPRLSLVIPRLSLVIPAKAGIQIYKTLLMSKIFRTFH